MQVAGPVRGIDSVEMRMSVTGRRWNVETGRDSISALRGRSKTSGIIKSMESHIEEEDHSFLDVGW